MAKGYKHTKESIEKIRASKKGFKPTLEHRLKISKANSGANHPMWGKKHTEESKQKMSKSHLGLIVWNKGMVGFNAGIRHGRWIADRTKVVGLQDRNNPEYKQWRKSVRDRDGWVCKISNGDCLGKVVAHHILPWRDYPELRYNINNGITLCRFHHPKKRADEIKLSPYFQRLVLSNRN